MYDHDLSSHFHLAGEVALGLLLTGRTRKQQQKAKWTGTKR